MDGKYQRYLNLNQLQIEKYWNRAHTDPDKHTPQSYMIEKQLWKRMLITWVAGEFITTEEEEKRK